MVKLNVSSERARRWMRWLIAAGFVLGGTMHFMATDAYVGVMPPYIPAPRLMVLVSGVFEIAGGIGLLIPALRKWAAWGLVALLVAVFPANVHMALNPEVMPFSVPDWALGVRLPVQFVLIALVLWVGRSPATRRPA